jgi:Chaperone of endosialidase
MSTTLSAGTATTGAALASDTSGVLQLQSGSTPTTAVTIDTAQNVGVGVTPSSWGSGYKTIQVGGGSSGNFLNLSGTVSLISFNAYFNGSNYVYQNTGVAGIFDFNGASTGGYSWRIAASGSSGATPSFTQAMTLTNGGNLLVGTTTENARVYSATSDNTVPLRCYAGYASYSSDVLEVDVARNTTNGSFKAISYYNTGAAAYKFYVIDSGAIYSTSTSITSISDQRFKENIKDIDVGLNQILSLKPRRFDWIDGKGEDRKNAVGFIAQEVQSVLPDLINNFVVNPEDKTEYLGLRSQDLIPTMVKAIQELSAQVTALQAEVTALKGAK